MINLKDKPMQLRTCQECFHQQFTRVPPEDRSDKDYWKWAELKCNYCKSEALDFGNTVQPGQELK